MSKTEMENLSQEPQSNLPQTKDNDGYDNKPWKTKKRPNFDYENLLSLDIRDRINPADFDLDQKLFGDKFIYYYKVKECDTNKPFFAKILRRNKYKDRENLKSYEQYRDNLLNELNIISELNHPSIIKYIGFSSVGFSQKHQPAILAEFVHNGSLSKIIQAAKENPESATLNDTQKLINIYGIALGMSYLHDYNILHRNITPSSILENENYYPIISNFDFAYVLEDGETVHTQQGYTFGIPSFVAPETYSKHEYSKKTDVYSFGMTIYTLLTNEIPFSDKQNTEISTEITQGHRPEFKTSIPASYKELIEACWDQDPEKRPTFEEIVNLLRNDSKFITDNINSDEFQKYIKFVYDFFSNELLEDDTENPDEKLIEAVLKRRKLKRPKAMLNLTNPNLIAQGNFYETFTVQVKDTDTINIAKVFYSFLESYPFESQSKIFRIVKSMISANHPAITKYIEFSRNGFGKEYRPTLLTEYKSKIKLTDIINQNAKSDILQKWTATKKLINIYGIASAMLYLHSRDILHKDLTPMNIYEDDELRPEINDSAITGLFRNLKTMAKIKYASPYYAPEFYSKNEYSKKSEVYSYSLIVYSIITNSIPYKNEVDVYEHANRIYKPERPPLNTEIPKAYRELIESCWSEKPNDRPSFEKIVRQLKTDPNFITDSINIEEYGNYIKFIDSSLQTLIDQEKNAGKTIECKNEYYEKLKEQQIKKQKEAKKKEKNDKTETKAEPPIEEIKPPEDEIPLLEYMIPKNKEDDEEEEEEEEEEEVEEVVTNLEESSDKPIEIDNVKLVNLKYYRKESQIGQSNFANIYRVSKNKSKKDYAAKVFSMEMYDRFKEEIIPTVKLLKREIILHSELIHPLVTSFIGYSPIDFDHRTIRPVMIHEYCRNGSLKELIDNLQENIKIPKWDATKKLINIYGIAACMKYLHSKNILHRDLSLSNVLLNESLYPKLTDFGLAIKENEIAQNSNYVTGTDQFIAPEIWKECKYSKASDVYAFAIIAYSILTNKPPTVGINCARICYMVTTQNFRLELNPDAIPKCFIELITNCWQEDPNNRLSFEEIVKQLKENDEFRKGGVDDSEYSKYIDTIEEHFRKLQKQHERKLKQQQLEKQQQEETKEQKKE